MNRKAVIGILAAAVLSMPACCPTGKIMPEASEITLEAAMKSVGEGLKQMKIAQGDMKTGLLPSEVTVSFNIAASASDKKGLTIALGTPQGQQLPITGNISGNLESAITAARGNVITIKFTNLLYAPKEQLITMKSAEEIGSILKALKADGITVYMVQ
jgi:hypothetical protein